VHAGKTGCSVLPWKDGHAKSPETVVGPGGLTQRDVDQLTDGFGP
jgi:hypothetical protein